MSRSRSRSRSSGNGKRKRARSTDEHKKDKKKEKGSKHDVCRANEAKLEAQIAEETALKDKSQRELVTLATGLQKLKGERDDLQAQMKQYTGDGLDDLNEAQLDELEATLRKTLERVSATKVSLVKRERAKTEAELNVRIKTMEALAEERKTTILRLTAEEKKRAEAENTQMVPETTSCGTCKLRWLRWTDGVFAKAPVRACPVCKGAVETCPAELLGVARRKDIVQKPGENGVENGQNSS